MEVELYNKLEEHSVGIAKLELAVTNMDNHVEHRFGRLEMFFNEVEKNSDFRKKASGGLKVFAVIMPIIAAVIIFL